MCRLKPEKFFMRALWDKSTRAVTDRNTHDAIDEDNHTANENKNRSRKWPMFHGVRVPNSNQSPQMLHVGPQYVYMCSKNNNSGGEKSSHLCRMKSLSLRTLSTRQITSVHDTRHIKRATLTTHRCIRDPAPPPLHTHRSATPLTPHLYLTRIVTLRQKYLL